MILRALYPDRLLRFIPEPERCGSCSAVWARELLQNLSIGYRVTRAELARIPTGGSAMIVANGVLASVPALREKLIFINSFERASPHDNRKSLRDSLEWLASGGLLVMFPAGGVSHLSWGEFAVADPEWNTTAARSPHRFRIWNRMEKVSRCCCGSI